MDDLKVITLTESATNQVLAILKTDKAYLEGVSQNKQMGLRVGVVGGGCSGLSYKIEFGEYCENDHTTDFESFKVFIDPKSSIYLKGVLIDYKEGLDSKGFIFSNPNASNSCGCGESFSV